MNREAILWKAEAGGRVACQLCAHRCHLPEGARGPCWLRRNEGGRLLTEARSELRVAVLSAIERKPLFHFLPGAKTWTLATAGCNLRCAYCQNAALSQIGDPRAPAAPQRIEQKPEKVVQEAKQAGAKVVAFSFSEPSVAYEWVREVMVAARQEGLRTVWVTNGFFTPELVEQLAKDGPPDAANVDLKAASKNIWRKVMGGRSEPVLETLSALRQLGVWVEVTTVLIPGMNGREERAQMAAWLQERLGPEAPWHLWRFHPDFRLKDRGPLSSQALLVAGAEARQDGLHHVYLGPGGGTPDQETSCAGCGEVLLARRAYEVETQRLECGKCRSCGRDVAGVWS